MNVGEIVVHEMQGNRRFVVLRGCLSAPWKGAELQWESKPIRQTFAPAGSSRGVQGSNELCEALGAKGS
jgi:hypothetical protein